MDRAARDTARSDVDWYALDAAGIFVTPPRGTPTAVVDEVLDRARTYLDPFCPATVRLVVIPAREPESADWSAPPGLTFREWLRAGDTGGLRAPTQEDLDYHLSTLFPPVRPRGHMEVRVIDAQPGDGWIVPAAVATALTADECASERSLVS